MAKYECPVCGDEFDKKTKFKEHIINEYEMNKSELEDAEGNLCELESIASEFNIKL